MKLLTALLALGAVMAPAQAATPSQVAGAGYIGGQILCTLSRHGAPDSVIREEMRRVGAAVQKDLGFKLHETDVAALEQHFAAVLNTCPPRVLPDA